MSRTGTRSLWALATAALLTGPLGSAEERAAPTSRQIVIAEEYRAGVLHRWLWGQDYRRSWTTPVAIEELDLGTFAGGLQPLGRVGGQQTRGLALRGADGRHYTFRGLDKDPRNILPPDLRDTWVRSLVQDQIAASQPAAFLVVEELMQAAGVLHGAQRLVVMPDDPRLASFRQEFAGVVGQLYEYPVARSATNPGFAGALEVLDHNGFYQRLASSPAERADARAFLRARLLDILIGDWDRHRDQWRWAKIEGRADWQPIPDDRDQAFSRYEGLILGLARARAPMLQNYGETYPGMTGLTWNGWEQDRQLLAWLDRSVWKEVAADLASRVTDDVIERAARRMPAELFELDGPRLIHDLTGRRNRLPAAAEAFYRHLAGKVRFELTDASEVMHVERLPGGDTSFQVWLRGVDGGPVGEPFGQRTLRAGETQEVSVLLRGGNDRVVTRGPSNEIVVRVLGGPGQDVVDDSRGGGARVYGDSVNLVPGPGSRLDRRSYTPPPPPERAPWIPPRDWGRTTVFVPWLGYGQDLGLFVGGGFDTRAFGFRKDPYSSRHVLRAGWSFGESTFRADYLAELRPENRGLGVGWHAYASGLESSSYFGFGNDTTDDDDATAGFHDVEQQRYTLTPVLTIPLAAHLTFAFGPTVKYAATKQTGEPTLLDAERPYGYGHFGQVGTTAVLQLDSRVGAGRNPDAVVLRTLGYPRGGALIRLRGQFFPEAWDVEEAFGAVDGSAAVYLTPGGDRAPTLGLRAGGRKVFGRYPFFEAAYLGGGLSGFDLTVADALVRGLTQSRYAGDGAVFANADLRLPISRLDLLLPGEWGVFGFADAGRVYLEDESSDTWHHGVGGGLWFAWLDRSNAISVSYAHSEGRNAVYVRAGFAF